MSLLLGANHRGEGTTPIPDGLMKSLTNAGNAGNFGKVGETCAALHPHTPDGD